MAERIVGYCPMGCGQTLFVGQGGFITCAFLECPEPDAVATILDDRETEHQVTFGPNGWIIRHPLRERLRDELLHCALHSYCEHLDGPPIAEGIYRATYQSPRWLWTPIDLLDGDGGAA